MNFLKGNVDVFRYFFLFDDELSKEKIFWIHYKSSTVM